MVETETVAPERATKRGFNGAMMRRAGTPEIALTVTNIEQLTPHVIRLGMRADEPLDEQLSEPTSYLRFWFPDPEDAAEEHLRAYTLLNVDAAAGTFVVDVVLHEPAGPASRWVVKAAVGDRITANVLTMNFALPSADEMPDGYLLVGDSASLPAIREIVGVLPAGLPVEIYLEQHDALDRDIPLQTDRPFTTVHWVERENPGSLAAAIESRDWANWRVWTAPETASLKFIRERLKEFGFPRSEIFAQGYWVYGRAMGSKRTKEQKAADEQAAEAARATLEASKAAQTAETTAEPDRAEANSWRVAGGARLLAPLKSQFWAAGVTQAMITLLKLVPFVLLTEFARAMLAGADQAQLVRLGVWAAGFMLLAALITIALMIWMHLVDARFERQLRQRLLEKLTRVPLGWFSNRGSAGVTQLVRDDTLSLHYLVTHAVSDAVAAIVAPIAVLGYLFFVDWRIALALFIPVLAYIGAMYLMLFQSSDKTARALAWNEQMLGEASAYLEGQPVVRVFGGGAGSQFRRQASEFTDFIERWQRPFTGKKAFMDIATRPITSLLVITAVGTLLIVTGSMQPINILPFLFLGAGFGAQLVGIGFGLSGLRDGRVAARRLQNALDTAELLTQEEETSATDAAGLSFENATFEYRPGVKALDDVSFACAPGTLTAIVGPSGAGKSTLANLAARFYDVTAGAVRIGGADVRALSADELYRRIGFVFQDPQLVSASVSENIALARPEATREEIERAAKAAQIHERITKLANGYDTVITPDSGLSGGERQRLAIARAILADTPVLVLDEATAFADPESEFEVQQALRALTKEKTVLVIAHRLHTIARADQIVVLEGGTVAEIGTHEALLRSGGRYRDLWNASRTEAAA